jgi:saccharopine dehydrogenase-like NADP-dependent oxidoreductase
MVGHAMVLDLARNGEHEITAVDRDRSALTRLAGADGVHTREADLGGADAVREAVAEAELVINAVPGFMGFATSSRRTRFYWTTLRASGE